jgi:hypothetical protein
MMVNWTTIAAVAAGVGSIGSLVAVAWQLHSLALQTKEAARQAEASGAAVRASVYLTVQQTAIDLDRFFFEHPQLRAKFYGTISGAGTQDELQQADAAAEMVIDLFDMVTVHEMHMSDEAAAGWRAYIKAMTTDSEPLHGFWQRHKTWYGALRPLIDAEVSGRDSPNQSPADMPQAPGSPVAQTVRRIRAKHWFNSWSLGANSRRT